MHYRIEGPAKLGGRFKPAGNKNAALPILAGSLLADDLVVLDNVPDIRDVRTMIELMESVGATTSWEEGGRVVVDPRRVTGGELDADLSRRIRASILLAGPLLARTGSIVLPPPGGDVIGRRRLDTHFLALGKLGAEVEVGDRYELRTRRLQGADIFLDEPSVTGTENAILAAVTAEGTTQLRNAAAEPHVQDLCAFLVSMGAEIQGIGTHGLVIHGVDRLGGTSYRIGADHIEIGSVIGLAAITGSELVIQDVEAVHMDPLRIGFERLGVVCELKGTDLHVPADQSLEIEADLGD